MSKEIAFTPERVLMQDFTGVPAVVDLAAMRDALATLGGEASLDQPAGSRRAGDRPLRSSPSVYRRPQTPSSENVEHRVRAQPRALSVAALGPDGTFDGVPKVVPPGTGICHQVNLEYLSRVVFATADGQRLPATPWSVPTAHTTMVNGLGVLGWGVGGIEAEAAMLGQPRLHAACPRVVGLRSCSARNGRRHDGHRPGAHRSPSCCGRHGVVGKFVEAFGPGVAAGPGGKPGHHRQHVAGVRRHLHDLPHRRRRPSSICASPGATRSRSGTGGGLRQGAQGLWHEPDHGESPVYSEMVEPRPLERWCRAWPARRGPQDRVSPGRGRSRRVPAGPRSPR